MIKTLFSIAVLHGFTYFFLVVDIPANPVFGSWVLAGLCLLAFRRLALMLISHSSHWKLPVIVFGDRQMIMDALYAFDADGQTGYDVQKILLRDQEGSEVLPKDLPKRYQAIEIISARKN